MKKKLIGTALAAALLLTGVGCNLLTADQQKELDGAIRTAIIKALDERGQKEAEKLVDKLVTEGKLSEATANALKAAIPGGIEKLKKALEEAGK